jgi:hypothetical protein
MGQGEGMAAMMGAEAARAWSDSWGWRVGCNFIPSSAGNQLEMWGREGFDPETIKRELGYAAGLGMGLVRVFLHDLAWRADPDGLLEHLERFLGWAADEGMGVLPVLFDDCWHEPGALGPKPEPVPGVHNSIWLRSPGLRAARDPEARGALESYVKGIVGAFSCDKRVYAWDIYNEVGNFFLPHLSKPFPRKQLGILAAGLRFYLRPSPTLPLFREAARWAREARPSQPLTSPMWFEHGGLNAALFEESDIASFHCYGDARALESRIEALRPLARGRPLVCTEFMARPSGSLFETCVPVFKEHGVSCLCWGLVAGRTQTIHAWRDRAGGAEPALWFHDVLRGDGSPYRETEAELLRSTGGDKGIP